MVIRPAGPEDHAAIRVVVAAAFGQPDEADLVDALRADGDALVELVAEEDGAVVGHILFSPLGADTGARLAALAPVSVTPDRQKDGLGTMLMEVGHELLRAAGVEAVIVLGHPAYYPRVGYSAEAAKTVAAPFSGPSFMALALRPGALDAPVAVTYAKAFGIEVLHRSAHPGECRDERGCMGASSTAASRSAGRRCRRAGRSARC